MTACGMIVIDMIAIYYFLGSKLNLRVCLVQRFSTDVQVNVVLFLKGVFELLLLILSEFLFPTTPRSCEGVLLYLYVTVQLLYCSHLN